MNPPFSQVGGRPRTRGAARAERRVDRRGFAPVSQPLHFGDYGGVPLQWLWAALDVLTIVVLGSGLVLWLGKRGSVCQGLASDLRGAVR